MLTYYYTLISDPCGRTVDLFLAYARAHPGCLLTLAPADLRAMQRAIAKAWSDDEHEYSAESEEAHACPRPAHSQLVPHTLPQSLKAPGQIQLFARP